MQEPDDDFSLEQLSLQERDVADSQQALVAHLKAALILADKLPVSCLHDSLLNDKCRQSVIQAIHAVQQADIDRQAAAAAAKSNQLPALDMSIIIHILSFMPSSCKAAVAKLVCKDAHVAFKAFRRMDPACMDLPQEYLLDFLREKGSIRWQQERLMEAVAQHGDLSRLQFLRKHGCAWDGHVYIAAAKRGDLDMLKWARSQDPPCPWPLYHNVVGLAAASGNFEILDWAVGSLLVLDQCSVDIWERAGPVVLTIDFSTITAQEYMQAHSLPPRWAVTIRDNAVGRPEVLQWALNHGWPAFWQPNICARAAYSGFLHTLQWVAAHQPALAWDEVECLKVAKHYGQDAVVEWLESRVGA